MAQSFWESIFGSRTSTVIKETESLVARINALEPTMQALVDADFPTTTQKLKDRLVAGESLDGILPEAYALVREASIRTMGGMRHYDVQMIGGIVLHRGMVAEMRTGEGKTLVATLPVYLNALTGKGVHVVTVNDYLARRDAQWMGQLYSFLGLSIAVINDANQSYRYDAGHQDLDEKRDEEGSFKIFYEFLKPCSRQEAYQADITYGTNNQFGFDYLRDNTQRRKENLVQRGHHYVVVDEIDSILIDEARVPLILSTQSSDAESIYRTFATVAEALQVGEHYTVDEKYHAIQLTDAGIQRAEELAGVENIYTAENVRLVHHLETAVKAKALYLKDREYVIKNNAVIIVDPFTGRMQDGRRWSDGLHQAVEAKEGVIIQPETRTLASITYQNYFKLYGKLSGMTGTAATSEEEFRKVYGLDVIIIPTHRAIARIDHDDLIYQTEDAKFIAVAKKVKELQEKGQPVLIGTTSVEKNELLSAYLTQAGVRFAMLNAKNHEQEGEIIANAGKPGAVTLATNMAGRGVDIKLGGPLADETTRQNIKDIGGLYVIGTERHEARRVDNQLRGRSGRQGDPGETQIYVCLDDPLMRIFGSDRIKGLVTTLGLPLDVPIQNGFISKQLEKAQEKIEGMHFDSRKQILAYDTVLSYHRDLIYKRRHDLLFTEPHAYDALLAEIAGIYPDTETMLAEKKAALGEETFTTVIKEIALQVLDRLWMEHLEVMDQTRQSVNLRSYGQREPIVEYKREGLRLFKELEYAYTHEVADILTRASLDDLRGFGVRITAQDSSERIIESDGSEEESESTSTSNSSSSDSIRIRKDGITKEVKQKKLDTWLAAGWVMEK